MINWLLKLLLFYFHSVDKLINRVFSDEYTTNQLYLPFYTNRKWENAPVTPDWKRHFSLMQLWVDPPFPFPSTTHSSAYWLFLSGLNFVTLLLQTWLGSKCSNAILRFSFNYYQITRLSFSRNLLKSLQLHISSISWTFLPTMGPVK